MDYREYNRIFLEDGQEPFSSQIECDEAFEEWAELYGIPEPPEKAGKPNLVMRLIYFLKSLKLRGV